MMLSVHTPCSLSSRWIALENAAVLTPSRSASLAQKMMRPLSRTPEKGADTVVWLASAPEIAGKTNGFYVDRAATGRQIDVA